MTTATTTLTPPRPVDVAGIHTRPGLARLVAVELRKAVDTRAGFWLQVAMIGLTALLVIVRLATGDAADHTFTAVLDLGIQPAAVLLPVVGVLLVTSEWSQRTGLITFSLVPVRSRVLVAKLVASLILATTLFVISVAMVAAGVLVAGPDGAFADGWVMIGQSAVFVITGIVSGFAWGSIVLASAPAIVALFALPMAWAAAASLAVFEEVAPWVDTLQALGPLHREVVTATQWAQALTALSLWMVLPLLIGIWRITRRPVAV
jgi:ABC-type transport system involved in multi-copper enzyme maturation permease subunit